jgi:hypothetical protein
VTYKEVYQYLTETAGLSSDDAKRLMSDDAAANKQTALVRKAEYDQLESRAADLEMSLNGTKDKPGASQYQKWYQDNYAAVQKLQADVEAYKAQYGDLSAPKPGTPQAAGGGGLTKDEVARLVNEQIQTNYAPRWTQLLKGSGQLIERHMRAGYKQDIDWDKVSELAATRNGDLAGAYDEWIAPEAKKLKEQADEKEVEKRVQARLEAERKKSASTFFPAGADSGSGSGEAQGLRRREPVTADKKPVYNRESVVAAAMTGKYEGFGDSSKAN